MKALPHAAILLLASALASCEGGEAGGASRGSLLPAIDATVTIDNRGRQVRHAPVVNRRLLGSNVQWTDAGDGLYDAGASTWQAVPMARTMELAPTVIRYPGGGHADLYHWAAGVGTVRGTCEHAFTGAMQTVDFGTAEFLDLCQQTGADGLITINTLTGSATESADWVRYVNGASPSGTVPIVRDWEVGNEPYYENTSHPERDVTAAQFAAAYNAHTAAMIAADPRIRVDLPLLGPILEPVLNAGRRTWNADVLAQIAQRVDFVAVHNAYLPFYYPHDRVPSDDELLRSVLAGAPAVDADLTTLRDRLTASGISAPFAMTEHNALGTVFGTYSPIPRSDGLPASLAGAVYTADLLCRLATRDDVDSAQYWSLISNWLFGAMTWDGTPKPVFHALRGLDQAFVGRRLRTTVASPTVAVPGLGVLPAQAAVPLVGAFATGGSGMVRVVLVNRSPTGDLRVRLVCRGGAKRREVATVRTLNDDDPLTCRWDGVGTVDWVETTVDVDRHGATIDLPAHSLVIVAIPAPTGGVLVAGSGSG